jgi:ribosomal protein S18 acetylase RimI-like enzyme
MEDYEGYSIRRATVGDLEGLTRLHCASFTPDEHVPVMFGESYVRATYRWQLTQDSVYVLVADDHGRVIGLISVSDGSFTLPMLKACMGEMIKSLAKHPALLFKPQVWKRLIRRTSSDNKQADAIAHTPGMAQMIIGAVDSECRGRRIFPALIDATVVESTKRGTRAIRAGVYKRNIPVQRAFIKAGWLEAPLFETEDTKYYLQFLDPAFRDELHGL